MDASRLKGWGKPNHQRAILAGWLAMGGQVDKTSRLGDVQLGGNASAAPWTIHRLETRRQSVIQLEREPGVRRSRCASVRM